MDTTVKLEFDLYADQQQHQQEQQYQPLPPISTIYYNTNASTLNYQPSNLLLPISGRLSRVSCDSWAQYTSNDEEASFSNIIESISTLDSYESLSSDLLLQNMAASSSTSSLFASLSTGGIDLAELSDSTTTSLTQNLNDFPVNTNCFDTSEYVMHVTPLSPSSSTSSSLSLSVDSNFMLNNSLTKNFMHNNMNNQYVINADNYNNQLSSYSNHSYGFKHDVSVGTDFAINRNIRFKKELDENVKLASMTDPLLTTSRSTPNSMIHTAKINTHSSSHSDLSVNRQYDDIYHVNENETFKLIEKAQPKKSRTKYNKEQIEELEKVYNKNSYPDVLTIELLVKMLSVSKEKINIWFQNRRARSKRSGVNSNNNETSSSGENAATVSIEQTDLPTQSMLH